MQYHGGKARLAPHVATIIRGLAPEHHTYLEPFMGGANVFAAVSRYFARSIGADAMPDVAALWAAAAAGWEPPAAVSRETYESLRHAAPSALRGFVGFGCSFGGKFFAGYASNARGGNFAATARRGVLRKAAAMEGAEIHRRDYATWAPTEGWLVYCDPPYAGTTGYGWAGEFDSAAFYDTAERWAASGATVLVSEESAPAHWAVLMEREQRSTLAAGENRAARTERLYRVPAPVGAVK